MESDSCYYEYHLKALRQEMISYFDAEPQKIFHMFKLHGIAQLIAQEEELDEVSMFIVEIASYLFDIGVKPAMEKYGSDDDKLQEQEGPVIAQSILSELGIENYIIERICYLIGHRYTYDNVEGIDYQILIEADRIVSAEEISETNVSQTSFDFVTESGKKLYQMMFGRIEE